MTVLLKISIPGMTQAGYESSREHIAPVLRTNSACHFHIAAEEDGSLAVFEIWDSEAAWDEFFTATVVPNMPAGAPKPTPVVLPIWHYEAS